MACGFYCWDIKFFLLQRQLLRIARSLENAISGEKNNCIQSCNLIVHVILIVLQGKFNRKQNKYWIYVQTFIAFIPEPFRLKMSKTVSSVRVTIDNVANLTTFAIFGHMSELPHWASVCRPRPQMYKESINEVARETDIEQLCPFVSHYPTQASLQRTRRSINDSSSQIK